MSDWAVAVFQGKHRNLIWAVQIQGHSLEKATKFRLFLVAAHTRDRTVTCSDLVYSLPLLLRLLKQSFLGLSGSLARQKSHSPWSLVLTFGHGSQGFRRPESRAAVGKSEQQHPTLMFIRDSLRLGQNPRLGWREEHSTDIPHLHHPLPLLWHRLSLLFLFKAHSSHEQS